MRYQREAKITTNFEVDVSLPVEPLGSREVI